MISGETCCKSCGLAAVSGEQAFEDPRGCYVYILWGDNPDTPLYVGQSGNVFARIGTHLSDPRICAPIKRLQLIRCDGEHVMNATEVRLIQSFQPRLNILLNAKIEAELASEADA